MKKFKKYVDKFFNKKNPWFVGISTAVLSGLVVGSVFLYREKKAKQEILYTRIKFAEKLQEANLPQEALLIYDEALQNISEKDKMNYAHIHANKAQCYLYLAQENKEPAANLVRAAVSFEESIRIGDSKVTREYVNVRIGLAQACWELSWFKNAETNIAKSVNLIEDLRRIYPDLEITTPFPLREGLQFFSNDRNLETQDELIKKINLSKEILKICTLEKYPIAYALCQNELGFLYQASAIYSQKTMNLYKSIDAFRAALSIFTFEEYPQNYIDLNQAIALDYLELSDANATKFLEEALELATSKGYRNKTARIFEHLGFTYNVLSETREAEKNLNNSIYYYQKALEFYANENDKTDYGLKNGMLGDAYLRLSKIKDKNINQKKAVNYFEEGIRTLETCEPSGVVYDYAFVQRSMGHMYLGLAEIRDKEIYTRKGFECYEKVLKTLDPQRQPLEYNKLKEFLQNINRKK